MSDIFGFNPSDLGAAALLCLVVLLILNGRLVPRRTLEDAQSERDYWRAAHGEEAKARQAERELTNELLEVARTADHVLASLPKATSLQEVTTREVVEPPA
ncbi:hypothetical protein ACFWIB_15155 [Streptomyces sp. NPDC127051]|uniref:hypothetical protein n=1 Tax=Streptomyces sp. NPDC127051 TaxID=3347119 RepID=UPI00364F8ACF